MTARRPVVGVAAMVLVLSAAAGAAAQTGAPDGPVGRTSPVKATATDTRPTRTYEPPSLLVHPTDPGTVVGATMELSSGECRLLRSHDGGRGWDQLDGMPSPPDFPLCFRGAIYGYLNETPIAWGRDNTLYWGINGFHPGRQDRDVSVLVARSANLGDTWSSTVVHDGRQATFDPPFPSRPVTGLAVDTRSGPEDIVYVAWESYPAGNAPRQVKLAVSTDGGRTFAAPVIPYDEEAARRFGGAGGLEGLPPVVRVAGDGTLYVLIPGRTTDTSLPPRILLARSEDRGRTFTVTEVATTVEPNSSPTLQWTPAGGPQGTLHVVFEDRRERPLGAREIYYVRSTDDGATFTPPRLLNDDDPAQRYSHFNPNLSVAPGGRLDVVWWDFRDGAGLYASDVYYAYSPDGGATWSRNFRVTERSIDRKVGTWSNNFDYRAPPSVASTDETALVAWDDTGAATGGSDSQDVMVSTVQLAELPAENAALPYVVAALAGLAAGGLALLVVAGLARRRQHGGTGEGVRTRDQGVGGQPPASTPSPSVGPSHS